MNYKKHDELILYVANEIAKTIPNFCGVTLGGSRMHGLDDDKSDVEMYFYSNNSSANLCHPNITTLDKLMQKFGATHRRSDNYLWNEAPWGPHSFFVIDGLYFEIGYRTIKDTKTKLYNYLYELDVQPHKDCHDLGLGYMPSGFAASVAKEKLLICEDDNISNLKQLANQFPNELICALRDEYFDAAVYLFEGKLLSAVQRSDVFLYEVISNRIIRSLMVMAFAISKEHFPGDKWNMQLLLATKWQDAEQFINILIKHYSHPIEKLEEKREMIFEALKLIQDNI